MVKYFFAALIVASSAYAYCDSVYRGKHWYEPIIESSSSSSSSSSSEEFVYLRPNLPDISDLMKMHPKQLSALFEAAHEYHVMEPTLETAGDIQILKSVMNRKARAAAAVEQLAILNNPEISGMAENAVNPSARSVQRQDRDNSISQRVSSERENYALIFLTQPGCSSCELQRNVIASFADAYGWPVKEVDITDVPAAQARFDVRVTPTTLVAARESGQWQTVAIGAESAPTMLMNIDRAVRLMAGEISPEQWLTAPNQRNSLYDPKAW